MHFVLKEQTKANMFMLVFRLCFFLISATLEEAIAMQFICQLEAEHEGSSQGVLQRYLQQVCSLFLRMGNNISAGNELS
jgi:hypothetical protein